MDKDEARARLQANGHRVASEARLGNDSGWQLRVDGGAIVNVFDSGKVHIQGKNKDAITPLFEDAATRPAVQLAPTRNVFVVYGHDPVAREQLEAMLRRWQLEPLILDQLPSEGQTLIEKLERVRGTAAFSVVLATPDDEGHRAGRPDEKAYRASECGS